MRRCWAVVLGLEIKQDGDQYCILWGENLQTGVAGFGKTPADAIAAFEQAMYESATKAGAQDSTLKTLADSVAKRASCELALIETAKVRDEWCAEFVKARNALKAIFDATDPYADGVVDAGAHAHLALEISSIARPWKDAQP